jgi:hypothetical protein
MSFNSSISGIKKSRARSCLAIGALAATVGGVVACSAVDGEAENGEGAVAANVEALGEPPALPSPRAFASALDLECYPSEGPPPVQQLGIRQLNPVLKDRLPNQQIQLGDLMRTCLPVAKNNNVPGDNLRRFISQVDLACYKAQAAPVNVPVNLRHINPVLQGLPDNDVRLVELTQFCSPVRKNFAEIEPEVRRLVQHLDFACYRFEEPTAPANVNLWLSHLNPVVRAFGFPNRLVQLERSKHLCVPVGKNVQPIPEDVKDVVEWVDFMQYDMDVVTPVPEFQLWLQQLNPLFAGTPPTLTWLRRPTDLLVPVAKDDTLPPI